MRLDEIRVQKMLYDITTTLDRAFTYSSNGTSTKFIVEAKSKLEALLDMIDFNNESNGK